jgi:hypothetical protein
MIIQNAVKVTCTKKPVYLVSTHSHDFQSMEMPNGKMVAVDGGRSYIRRCFTTHLDGYEEWNLDTMKSDFNECVAKLLWGTRGKNGDEPLTYVLLYDCNVAHLKAILDTQPQIKDTIYERVIQHLLYLKRLFAIKTKPVRRIKKNILKKL